jgi:hypothetical protein
MAQMAAGLRDNMRLKKRSMGSVKNDMRIKRVSMEMTSDIREWKKKTCSADPT